MLHNTSQHNALTVTETGFPMTSTCYGLNMDLQPPTGVTGKPVPGWNGEHLHSLAASVLRAGDPRIKPSFPWSVLTNELNIRYTLMAALLGALCHRVSVGTQLPRVRIL